MKEWNLLLASSSLCAGEIIFKCEGQLASLGAISVTELWILQKTHRRVFSLMSHLDIYKVATSVQLHLHVKHVGCDVTLCTRWAEVRAQPDEIRQNNRVRQIWNTRVNSAGFKHASLLLMRKTRTCFAVRWILTDLSSRARMKLKKKGRDECYIKTVWWECSWKCCLNVYTVYGPHMPLYMTIKNEARAL